MREILVRALHPPLRDRSFWLVQLMVVVWAIVHLLIDVHGGLDSQYFPYGIPIDLLLIPVGFAALHYGLSGSGATTVWAVLLWTPDLALSNDLGHYQQDLVQLGVVLVVALFVGLEIERVHLERARAETAEAERRAAEVHYRELFETNASPILLLDATGVVIERNDAALALWPAAVGARVEDLLDVEIDDLVEVGASPIVTVAATSGDERTFRLSTSWLGPVGERSSTQVVLEDITDEYRSEIEARAWASDVLRAQEQERRRIAREIHDDPLQKLLQLARRVEELGRLERTESDQFDEVRAELLSAVAHLRDVTRGLHPAGLDQHGLVAAVRGLLIDVEIEESIATTFELVGEVTPGYPDVDVGIFRIVQEAVRNVVHHAHAQRLDVRITCRDDEIQVVVADNGRGYDAASAGATRSGHLGILSMYERANLLGGTCVVRGVPHEGTVVEASIPLHPTVVRAALRLS